MLITDKNDADVSRLTTWAKENGAPVLAIPKKILKVEVVPVLGSGKTDYVTLQKMADVEARRRNAALTRRTAAYMRRSWPV